MYEKEVQKKSALQARADAIFDFAIVVLSGYIDRIGPKTRRNAPYGRILNCRQIRLSM